MAKPLKYNKSLYIRVTDELFEELHSKSKMLGIPSTIWVRQVLEEKILFSPKSEKKKEAYLNYKEINMTNTFFKKSISLIKKYNKISPTLLIEKLNINYLKAIKIINLLEKNKIISKSNYLNIRTLTI